MTTLLTCACKRVFEPLIVKGEITVQCEACAPIDWARLKRAARKAS